MTLRDPDYVTITDSNGKVIGLRPFDLIDRPGPLEYEQANDLALRAEISVRLTELDREYRGRRFPWRVQWKWNRLLKQQHRIQVTLDEVARKRTKP